MNGFSELLNKAIQTSGCTIYQLSKLSGVNRTSVQRALKEGRVLQPESFQRLLPCLKLSAREQERLSDSYEELYYGRALFSRRKYVKEILESIPEKRMGITNSLEVIRGEKKFTITQEKCLYTGHSEITQLLHDLADKEAENTNGELLLFLSAAEPFSGVILKELAGGAGRLRQAVRHLIPLIKNPAASIDANYNLKCFASVLPYMFARDLDYQVYYDYTVQDAESNANAYFPYFVIFSRGIALLSPDLKTAWYAEADGLVRHYRDAFYKRMKSCKRLSKSSPDYYAMGYNTIYQDLQVENLCWLEYQPCLIPLCTVPVMERAVAEIPAKKEIMELVGRRTKQMRGISEKIGLFQKESIMDFVERGRLLNLPEGLVRPLEKRDRLFLLEELYHVCSEDREVVRAIVPGALMVPQNVSVALHGGRSFMITRFHEEENLYDTLEIEESTLGEAFWDFMSHAVDTPMVCSKKETLKIIWDGMWALKQH